jgi:hypothetical protein
MSSYVVKNPMTSKLPAESMYDAAATPRSTKHRDDFENDDEPAYSGRSSHPAASSAMGPMSYGENSLLHHIERKEEEDESILNKGRGRSATVVADELHIRPRRQSIEGNTERSHVFEESKTPFRKFFDFSESIVPRLQQRLRIYFTIFFLIILLTMGRYYSSPKSWFVIFFIVISVDIATAIVDQMIFVYFIDKIFVGHFEIAYLLHGFNGPLGLLVAVFIIGAALKDFPATKAVPNWDHLVSACTIIVLCICVKNWYSRKHYTGVLERRFSDRLFKLQTWTVLLSELSTYRILKKILI